MKNKYEINGNEIIIQLNKYNGDTFYTTVSIDKLGLLINFDVEWRHQRINSNIEYAYATIYSSGKKFKLYLHRFLLCLNESDLCIDHINGNGLNNTNENIRMVTQQENCFNRRDVKGYTKVGNQYKAQIRLNNKLKFLGYFNTENEARDAYLKAKSQMHVIVDKEILENAG